MIILYRHPESLYCANVKLLLEELSIPYQTRDLDLAGGEHMSPANLRKYPLGRVPFIDVNGFALGESGAILRYLAMRHLAYHWYPYNLEDRALVDQWMDFFATHCNKPLGEYIWYKCFAAKYNVAVHKRDLDLCEQRLRRELPMLDQYMQGRSYFAEALPTLADVVLTPFLAVAVNKAGLSLANFMNLSAWLRRMTNRAAFASIKSEIY